MSGLSPQEPLRVLFLCTRNSARSQIAEALLQKKGRDRFLVGSAGVNPGERIHPGAVAILRDYGIEWMARPKSIETVRNARWDLIITVCDRAQETCPTFPGQPIFAHWGLPDPAAIVGSDAHRRKAFDDTLRYLSRRIDLMLALPIESLERRALEIRLEAIGDDAAVATLPFPEA